MKKMSTRATAGVGEFRQKSNLLYVHNEMLIRVLLYRLINVYITNWIPLRAHSSVPGGVKNRVQCLSPRVGRREPVRFTMGYLSMAADVIYALLFIAVAQYRNTLLLCIAVQNGLHPWQRVSRENIGRERESFTWRHRIALPALALLLQES